MGVDGEVVVLSRRSGEVGEGGVGDVDDGPAVVADQVCVAVLAQVVEGRAEPGVDVFDDLEIVEALQDPVDGRRRDARRPALDLGDEVIGGQVLIRVGQRGDEDSRRHGESTTGFTNQPKDPVLIGLGHFCDIHSDVT